MSYFQRAALGGWESLPIGMRRCKKGKRKRHNSKKKHAPGQDGRPLYGPFSFLFFFLFFSSFFSSFSSSFLSFPLLLSLFSPFHAPAVRDHALGNFWINLSKCVKSNFHALRENHLREGDGGSL